MHIIHHVNEKHSLGGWNTEGVRVSTYRPRWLVPQLRASVETSPVTVLTGARQVGKSTLLANEAPFSEWRYVTLDDYQALAEARSNPESLWAGASAVVIDEAQRAPELLSAIKRRVDADRSTIRFVLSGSANLLLMSAVSESLAGRANYLKLGPLTLGEIARKPIPDILERLLAGDIPGEESGTPVDPHPYLYEGTMPPLLDAPLAAITRWWEGYTATYLERDLRQLSQVESLPDFRRVMEGAALSVGSVLNQTSIGRDLGVPQATVHRYLNVLEASNVLIRVPGFAASGHQRLSKRPKAYLFDSGAAAYLCGHYSEDAVRASRERGGLFEGFVLQHLAVLAELMTPHARLYYWRTGAGVEVDFVVEHGRRLLPVEVKLTANPGFDDVRALKVFLQAHPEAPVGVLIHTGGEVRRLGERIIAMPWTHLVGIDS